MTSQTRTDRTDRQIQKLPHWAQEVAVTEALEQMRNSEFGRQASFQDALENILDQVFCDDYVFANIVGEKCLMHALDFPEDRFGRITTGTLVIETQTPLYRDLTDQDIRQADALMGLLFGDSMSAGER